MFTSLVEKIMDNVYLQYWKNTEDKRIIAAQRIWSWYFNDKDDIQALLMEAMKKIFRPRTLARMNLRVLNIVERVASRLAQVYKKPAERVLADGVRYEKNEAGILLKTQSKGDALYQDILQKSTINKRVAENERQMIMFNTTLVQPIWRGDGEIPFMDFLIHTPAYAVVETDPDNWLKPKLFYYPSDAVIGGKRIPVLVYWDEERHFLIDKNGQEHLVPTMNNDQNPYGILPIAVARLKEGNDFWGEGRWNLVDGNEEICIQVNNLFYATLWQTHGQAVAVNMNLGDTVDFGPDRPIVRDKADDKTQQAASFEFQNANPMVAEVKDLVDWLIKMLHGLEGITGSSLSGDPVIQSGISKIQDSAELQEARESSIAALQDFEHDLFNVTKAVYNYHNPTSKIPDEPFSVRFYEPKIIKTIAEKKMEREMALAQGTGSRVDFIMEDHPELSREKAQEKLADIVSENQMFNDTYGINKILAEPDNKIE